MRKSRRTISRLVLRWGLSILTKGERLRPCGMVTPPSLTLTSPGYPAEAPGYQQASPPRKQDFHRGGTSGVWRWEALCFPSGGRKRWSDSCVFGNRSGVGCDGCHADGAYDTCAVYVDFLSQFRDRFPPNPRSLPWDSLRAWLSWSLHRSRIYPVNGSVSRSATGNEVSLNLMSFIIW